MRYDGERFEKYFSDFHWKYGITDMYSGGFYPFDTLEEYWAYWSRYIMVNRYMNAPKPIYQELLALVKDRDHFVLATNVDHCFQKTGFDKKRIFYTQGDYGLFQCSAPCHQKTYDNEETVRQMVKAQGYTIMENGEMELPDNATAQMTIPSELVPHCPICGKPMTMNLRCDDTFVEDDGWHNAAERYSLFLRRHQNLKTMFLELGTGMNTPGIIKFSFWRMVRAWPDSTYACINLNEAYAPDEIRKNPSVSMMISEEYWSSYSLYVVEISIRNGSIITLSVLCRAKVDPEFPPSGFSIGSMPCRVSETTHAEYCGARTQMKECLTAWGNC